MRGLAPTHFRSRLTTTRPCGLGSSAGERILASARELSGPHRRLWGVLLQWRTVRLTLDASLLRSTTQEDGRPWRLMRKPLSQNP